MDSLLFMQEHVGQLPRGDYTGMEPTGQTCERTEQLFKAAAFLKHRTWFEPDARNEPGWLAKQSMEHIGEIMFGKDRSAKHQLLSASQVEAQCAKMDARLTEWATAHLTDPGLVKEPKRSDGSWSRKAEQLKGLAAYVNGDLSPGTAITPENARSRFGQAQDTGPWAMALGAALAEKYTKEILTDAEVLGLTEDVVNIAHDQLVQLGYRRLKANIKSRDSKAKPTNAAVTAAAVLRKMARESAEAAASPASPARARGSAASSQTPQAAPMELS
jgi:hypothetical protein